MGPTLVSAVVTGLVIGALGRALSPSTARMGCLLTMLIGIAASMLGSIVAIGLHVGWVATIVIQVVLAAVLVSLVRV